MADVGSLHFVKGRGTEVLVPQPSADPHDPLVRTACPCVQTITILLANNDVELEQEVEVPRHVDVHNGLLFSRLRSSGPGTHVSQPHASIRFRPSRRHSIHRRMYPGSRL